MEHFDAFRATEKFFNGNKYCITRHSCELLKHADRQQPLATKIFIKSLSERRVYRIKKRAIHNWIHRWENVRCFFFIRFSKCRQLLVDWSRMVFLVDTYFHFVSQSNTIHYYVWFWYKNTHSNIRQINNGIRTILMSAFRCFEL